MTNKIGRKWFFWMFIIFCFLAGSSGNLQAKAIVSTGHSKYTYKEMVKDLKLLKKRYSSCPLQVDVIGKTPDNRNLYEVILGNPKGKKHLLVISNLHAREYMTTQLTLKQIEYYLSSYHKKIQGKKVSDTVKEVSIHFIPSANPDGTAISQKGFKAIRNKKLRKALKKMGGSSRRWKANARGVDLNRNWKSWFKKGGKRGASGYRGPRAESEPEVKAIVRRINQIEKNGRICGVISYHSTGSILYGRCAGQARASTRKATNRMASLAGRLTGYGLMPVESVTSARGCSREYLLYKRQIPCITLEVGRGACPLGAGEFPSIWKKNKNLVIREAQLFQ